MKKSSNRSSSLEVTGGGRGSSHCGDPYPGMAAGLCDYQRNVALLSAQHPLTLLVVGPLVSLGKLLSSSQFMWFEVELPYELLR